MNKKSIIVLVTFFILIIFIGGCAQKEGLNGRSDICKTDKEGAKCSITKDGVATLSNLNLPTSAQLTEVKISPCEITERLWSCQTIGTSIKDCEIININQPFKAKCPIEKGAWMVKFEILKPEGCTDPIDPSVKRDCEEFIRAYQIV